MDEYEESNALIQTRHLKLFKDDTDEFEASKNLLMWMPLTSLMG
jgi:hypothetical protein